MPVFDVAAIRVKIETKKSDIACVKRIPLAARAKKKVQAKIQRSIRARKRTSYDWTSSVYSID